jgi:hypothetical protein
MSDLLTRRSEAAEAEWQGYDFGPEVVEDASGWESETPGREMSRPVYFRDAEDPDGPTIAGRFVVEFGADDSDEVIGARATIGGNDVGFRPQSAAAPRF